MHNLWSTTRAATLTLLGSVLAAGVVMINHNAPEGTWQIVASDAILSPLPTCTGTWDRTELTRGSVATLSLEGKGTVEFYLFDQNLVGAILTATTGASGRTTLAAKPMVVMFPSYLGTALKALPPPVIGLEITDSSFQRSYLGFPMTGSSPAISSLASLPLRCLPESKGKLADPLVPDPLSDCSFAEDLDGPSQEVPKGTLSPAKPTSAPPSPGLEGPGLGGGETKRSLFSPEAAPAPEAPSQEDREQMQAFSKVAHILMKAARARMNLITSIKDYGDPSFTPFADGRNRTRLILCSTDLHLEQAINHCGRFPMDLEMAELKEEFTKHRKEIVPQLHKILASQSASGSRP